MGRFSSEAHGRGEFDGLWGKFLDWFIHAYFLLLFRLAILPASESLKSGYQPATEDRERMIHSKFIVLKLWFAKIKRFINRILREQWIRAKYLREEFIFTEKQQYTRGTMEGYLFTRSKLDDQCKQRRFVLSERDNTLKYYDANVCQFLLDIKKCVPSRE